MRDNVSYIADTNINTLAEVGYTVEHEGMVEANCSSAEKSFLRTCPNHETRLGSKKCVELSSKPDGCIECDAFVKCILGKDDHIEYVNKRASVKSLKRVLNSLKGV